jgi:hypothetical protein
MASISRGPLIGHDLILYHALAFINSFGPHLSDEIPLRKAMSLSSSLLPSSHGSFVPADAVR